MSKQQQAKQEQGYEAKPVFPMCSNCKNFKSDIIGSKDFEWYKEEKNIRCGLGGFAIKKQGTCNKHQAISSPALKGEKE